jgi:hypothetical protein
MRGRDNTNMAVPCSKCGLEYDVALFGFGRTIHCTCGNRVGIEARVRELGGAELRFSADAMLAVSLAGFGSSDSTRRGRVTFRMLSWSGRR